MDRADNRHFRADNPTHDTAGFFAYAFDAGHQIRKIAELAKKLTSLFKGGS
jgi:hypothetical protein